jgi:hypothetical protein
MKKQAQIQALFQRFKKIGLPCKVVSFAETKLVKVKFQEDVFFLEFPKGLWSKKYFFLMENVLIIHSLMDCDLMWKFRMFLLRKGFFE